MRRPFAALLFLAVTAAAVVFEASPAGAPVRHFFARGLGENAISPQPAVVAAIEVPQPFITSLDAALVLRAVSRYEPAAVAFLVPLRFDGNESLFATKLAELKMPVLFTSNDRPEPLPGVTVSPEVPHLARLAAYVPRGYAAGGAVETSSGRVTLVARLGARAVASNVLCLAARTAKVTGNVPGELEIDAMTVPVDEAGCAHINPLAADYVDGISFGQLMLQTERSESGSISTALDVKFRGRLVAVQATGGSAAAGVAAMLNHILERPAPLAPAIFCMLVAASLPWWRGVRHVRILLAIGVCSAWLLFVLAIYQQFQMPLPVLPMLLLPLLAAFGGSQKSQQRKLPA
jgi:hypothetical protein